MKPPRASLAWNSFVLCCILACAGHSDAIRRGQRYYEDNQYERALAIWRDLERRQAAFSPEERARYAYLRGMTDFRLSYRDDARHWLAIAKAARERSPQSLDRSWNERLDSALLDLARGSDAPPAGDRVVQTIEAPQASTAEAPIRADGGHDAPPP